MFLAYMDALSLSLSLESVNISLREDLKHQKKKKDQHSLTPWQTVVSTRGVQLILKISSVECREHEHTLVLWDQPFASLTGLQNPT